MSRLRWQKSILSTPDAANCIEVAADASGMPHLRESDEPETVVTTTPAAFRAFLRNVKAGAFDGLGR